MLLKISWRNIWRNRLRSFVVITSILIGIWSGVFILGMVNGLNRQRINNAISSSISHIQIHHPGFRNEMKLENDIREYGNVLDKLKNDNLINSVTHRVIIEGMISSASGGFGVKVNGIIPEIENKVTTIHQQVTEGNYFEGKEKNPVLIGRKLAKKLNAKTGSKLILIFQNRNGDLVSAVFKVCGIYKTSNTHTDMIQVFVSATSIIKLLGEENLCHEISLLVKDFRQVPFIRERFQNIFPALSVETWDEIAPELGYANELMTNVLYIFIGIILMALSFSIINTMLMAVLERRRELGMLMAVGMNRGQLFAMIIIETVLLALSGGPMGLVLGYFTISHFGSAGINLGIFGEGLDSLGIGSVIYTTLERGYYLNVAVMIFITAILSAVYPALKALQLKPAEAVRG